MTTISNDVPVQHQNVFAEEAQHAKQAATQITNEVGPNLDDRRVGADTNTPCSGARDAVLTPYQQQKATVAERLADDPEYQDAQATLAQEKSYEEDFLFVEAHTLFSGDSILTLGELNAVANDPGNPAHDAANRMLQNQKIWNAVKKDDQTVSSADVTQFFAGIRSKAAEIKKTVTAEVKDEAKTKAADAAVGNTGTASVSNGAAATGPDALFAPPIPSTKPGLEGAAENATRALSAIGDASRDILAKLADPNLKPEEKQKLQQRFNELAQLQQMLTAMYAQLQEAISNMVKMYSGAAHNSIQNMR